MLHPIKKPDEKEGTTKAEEVGKEPREGISLADRGRCFLVVPEELISSDNFFEDAIDDWDSETERKTIKSYQRSISISLRSRLISW